MEKQLAIQSSLHYCIHLFSSICFSNRFSILKHNAKWISTEFLILFIFHPDEATKNQASRTLTIKQSHKLTPKSLKSSLILIRSLLLYCSLQSPLHIIKLQEKLAVSMYFQNLSQSLFSCSKSFLWTFSCEKEE